MLILNHSLIPLSVFLVNDSDEEVLNGKQIHSVEETGDGEHIRKRKEAHQGMDLCTWKERMYLDQTKERRGSYLLGLKMILNKEVTK